MLAYAVSFELKNSVNFAYQSDCSTTSLLLRQFDYFAKMEKGYVFNCDLVKAFDKVSRANIYKNISNTCLSSIVWE